MSDDRVTRKTWLRFKVARARAGYTFQAVADLCGVSPQAVKKWEDGDAMPSSERLLMVCLAFDCSLEWIMSAEPMDFHSTHQAPQGRHAKYWVREAMDEYFSRYVRHDTEGGQGDE